MPMDVMQGRLLVPIQRLFGSRMQNAIVAAAEGREEERRRPWHNNQNEGDLCQQERQRELAATFCDSDRQKE